MNALANEPLLPGVRGIWTKLDGEGPLGPVKFRDEKTVCGIGGRAVKLVNHRATLCSILSPATPLSLSARAHTIFQLGIVSHSTRESYSPRVGMQASDDCVLTRDRGFKRVYWNTRVQRHATRETCIKRIENSLQALFFYCCKRTYTEVSITEFLMKIWHVVLNKIFDTCFFFFIDDEGVKTIFKVRSTEYTYFVKYLGNY